MCSGIQSCKARGQPEVLFFTSLASQHLTFPKCSHQFTSYCMTSGLIPLTFSCRLPLWPPLYSQPPIPGWLATSPNSSILISTHSFSYLQPPFLPLLVPVSPLSPNSLSISLSPVYRLPAMAASLSFCQITRTSNSKGLTCHNLTQILNPLDSFRKP